MSELFHISSPTLENVPDVIAEMRKAFGLDPELIQAWQGFSEDTRCTPAPYIIHMEVGDFDGSISQVVVHEQLADAVIDYIFRRVFHRRLIESDFA